MPFIILIIFAFIGVVGYLAQLNPERVTFFITRQTSFEMPVTALILFSTAFGGLLVILSAGIRETRNLFLNWKYARLQKKRPKSRPTIPKRSTPFSENAIGMPPFFSRRSWR